MPNMKKNVAGMKQANQAAQGGKGKKMVTKPRPGGPGTPRPLPIKKKARQMCNWCGCQSKVGNGYGGSKNGSK